MVFEQFVSEARNEPPDIDVDFEHDIREEIIQYIYNKFSRHRTGLCATVVHFRTKRALIEVGEVIGLTIDIITILLTQLSGWRKLGSTDDRLRKVGINPKSQTLLKTLNLVDEIVGFPRHLSQHVGEFVITEDRLDELIPIENAAMSDRTIISWDRDDIDTLGILKVYILSLVMLRCIRKAFLLINNHRGQNYNLATVPQDDTGVYDMICKADTIGLFQVESRAQMNFLPRMLPRSFYDLVIQIAIVRPGPIQGNMVHPYIKRRQGKETVEFPSNPLKKYYIKR
jgi:DNA polymerase III alpha subunit